MGMFDKSKTLNVDTKKTAAKKVTVLTAGLEGVAVLDVVIKSLTGLKEMRSTQVTQGPMLTHFINTGLATNKAPESYRGEEGDAEGSLELRKRASSSPLTDDEIELMKKHKIPTTTITSRVETFVINPKYLTPDMMKKIEAALSKVKGMPEDLFLLQEGITSTIVADDAMDVLFKPNPAIPEATRRAAVEAVLPVISVMAIKPKMNVDDLPKAFAKVDALINPKKDKKAA